MKRVCVFFTAIFLCCFCHTETNSNSDIPVLDISLDKEVEDLTDYIEDVQVITLDSGIFVKNANKLLNYSDRFITDELIEFDKSGRLTKRYGNTGRGPGEYIHVSDICINSSGTELLCLDSQNTVLHYSLKDGSYLKSDKADMTGITATAILPMRDNGFALVFPNPPMEDIADFSKDFHCLKVFDSNGTMLKEDLPRQDFNISMFHSPATQMADNTYMLYFAIGEGPSYLFNGDSYSSEINLLLGDKRIPEKYAFHDGNKNPWLRVGDIFEQDFLKAPGSLCKTDKLYYCSVFGENSSVWNHVVDMTSGHGICWKSIGGDFPPMTAIASDNDYLYFSYGETGNSVSDPIGKLLREKKNLSLSDNDNPVIVKIKFKL